MIAAIYARKSTPQPGVSDEEKSVTRQVEHARAYAIRQRWMIADEHIYVDDDMSGAEFDKRPGFLRLMNALKPRAPFAVLLLSEASRLGREQFETGYALKQLSQAGVRCFSYLQDREIMLETATDKFLMSAVTFADELEREKARMRTYDALVRKARAGHVTGGGCFGYENDRRSDGVHRVIDEAEAAVVRRIFTLASQRWGLSRIAKTLNDEGVRSPRPQQDRPSGWAPSSIRAVLRRELYRGVLCWNKTRKRDRWGTKHPQARPTSDWLRVDLPELAIVSEALWAAAQAAMAQQREQFDQVRRFRHPGRLAGVDGIDTRHLLAGLLVCAQCRGGMEVRSRSHGRTRVAFVGCSSYHRRGRAICSNNLTVPEANANVAVLAAVETSLLNPRIIEAAVQRAVAYLCDFDDDGTALRQQFGQVERELERLTRAVSLGGGDVPILVAALREKEHQRRELQTRIRALVDTADRLEPGDVVADLRGRFKEWRSLLHDEPMRARGLLRQLLVGRLELTADADRRGYAFTGTGTLVPILAGVIPGFGGLVPRNGSSPTGFEPVFWP